MKQRMTNSAVNRLPVFAPASNNPQKKQSESAASRVQQHVPHRSLPRWHEPLVNLVGGCIKRDEKKSQTGLRPQPGTSMGCIEFSQCAPNEQPKKRIFSNVRSFANGKYNCVDRLIGEMRKEPTQNRRDDARRVAKRHLIAGRRKDDDHPNQNRNPINDEGSESCHAGWKQRIERSGKR